MAETKRKTYRLQVCLTPTELRALEAAARSENKDVSVWVRQVSLRAAQGKG